MGTWGPAIKSNDTSEDVYYDFFEHYNEGEEPLKIAEKLINESQELINDPSDSNNFWFALALALWETKNLPKDIYDRVKSIINNELDIKLWIELGAEKNDIHKRRKVLQAFLEKLSSPKSKPKTRKKKKFTSPIYKKGTCLYFQMESGNYGAAIVLEEDNETGNGSNLIAITNLNQIEIPILKQVEESNVLVKNFGDWEGQLDLSWILPDYFTKNGIGLFEVIGYLDVERNYSPDSYENSWGFSANWAALISSASMQFDYEEQHGSSKSLPIKKFIKKPRLFRR